MCVGVFACFYGGNQFVVDGVGVHNFYAKIHKQGEMAKFFFDVFCSVFTAVLNFDFDVELVN